MNTKPIVYRLSPVNADRDAADPRLHTMLRDGWTVAAHWAFRRTTETGARDEICMLLIPPRVTRHTERWLMLFVLACLGSAAAIAGLSLLLGLAVSS